jgi:hypothetical protein
VHTEGGAEIIERAEGLEGVERMVASEAFEIVERLGKGIANGAGLGAGGEREAGGIEGS